MDVFDPNLVCNVCGAADFYKEAGHFYCNECQTQSQQIQDHVFEQDTVALKTTKKIQNDEAKKNHKVLTSWECLNYILKGLTEELIELGAKPILKPVIKCLWMKYLHTCEVFDLESSKPPKISVLGPKKDITILYNVKRTKRKRSRASSTSTTMTLTRQRSNKKRALIQNEYKELSESKNLTQDDMVNDISLSNIKSGSESSEDSNKIHYNRISTKEIRKIMSKQHQKKHTQDLENNLTCHKFRAKTFKRTFYSGPANLTSFTLYSLLYIALLIIKDNIQLGDMFRYIREGHLSFGCFRHFFPSDLPEKALNMPLRKEKLFTSYHFRKRTAKLAQFLQVTKCINTPDLVSLCKRYCTELNLPNEIFYCVEQLIQKTQPKMKVQERTSIIPNYEARIMGMILFVLKLFYGLDGVTEHKISDYTKSKSEVKMFDLIKWLEYLGYRANIMKLYHLPTRFKEEECYVDSDLYLNYWKNQSVKFKGSLKGTFRQTRIEIQNYLQLFEDLIVNDNNEKDLIFEPSFTPFISYSKLLLTSKQIHCPDVLLQDFSSQSIDFLLNPRDYFKSIKSVKNGGANDNIFLEDFMYLYNSTIFMKERARNTVPVKISENNHSGDMFIDEFLANENKRVSTQINDVTVFLKNWQDGHKDAFSRNEELLNKPIKTNKIINVNSKSCTEYYNTFERYWLNVPMTPGAHYFTKHDVEKIIAKFPPSLQIIMKECARIVEQDTNELLTELVLVELFFTNFEFGKKKNKPPVIEIKKALRSCKNRW